LGGECQICLQIEHDRVEFATTRSYNLIRPSAEIFIIKILSLFNERIITDSTYSY